MTFLAIKLAPEASLDVMVGLLSRIWWVVGPALGSTRGNMPEPEWVSVEKEEACELHVWAEEQ